MAIYEETYDAAAKVIRSGWVERQSRPNLFAHVRIRFGEKYMIDYTETHIRPGIEVIEDLRHQIADLCAPPASPSTVVAAVPRPVSTVTTPTVVADDFQNAPGGLPWYFAKDERRKTRQVCIELPAHGVRKARFGALALNAKYENLLVQPNCAGFFRVDADDGPFLLVRADSSVDGLKNCPLRVAVSYYHEPTGAVLGLFVSAESDELKAASPTGFAVFECLYGLDVEDQVERIRDALKRDELHLCFASASANVGMTLIDASGNARRVSPPECRFDRVYPLPLECRDVLRREFEELIRHHRSLHAGSRDYPRSIQQLSADYPASTHPILSRAQSVAYTGSSDGRFAFWKKWFRRS